MLDPPVIAALRLGLYELLFADGTPDHAAVDQAVELVKRAGAAHAAGLVNAVLRRAARERARADRGAARRRLDPGARRGRPLGAALAGADVVGGARRRGRPLAARGLQRAGRDRASGSHGRADREAMIAVAAPSRASRRGVPSGRPGRWRRAESIVIEGRTGEDVPARVAAGELTPQSRGSAAVVEVLDPRPGEHVLDLCAGPGIKTGQIAARMEDRGEAISVELDEARAAEVAAQARAPGPAQRHRDRDRRRRDGRSPRGFDRVLVDAPCSDLGALASRPDARWRKSPRQIERLVEVQDRILRTRGAGCCAPAACSSTRPARSRAARTRTGSPPCSPPAPPARCRRSRVEDLGERAPGLASPLDSRFLQLRPDRDRTTGFFIARLKRDDD